MSYRLVIAEKPSVGAAYAKVLGATNRQDGYWEGNGYLVSWCIGHLVELAPPNVYDEKFVKWSVADLPILPEKWQYLVSASTKKQFGILKKLMNRPDVDSVTALSLHLRAAVPHPAGGFRRKQMPKLCSLPVERRPVLWYRIDNYEILYRGNLPTGKRSVPQAELLEQLYQKFNCAQPMDYHGHSLSVSDVILLNQAGKISAHYVDSIGFRELAGFQDKQERSSVLIQLKAKCDMPESNPTKCRKGRNDHAI